MIQILLAPKLHAQQAHRVRTAIMLALVALSLLCSANGLTQPISYFVTTVNSLTIDVVSSCTFEEVIDSNALAIGDSGYRPDMLVSPNGYLVVSACSNTTNKFTGGPCYIHPSPPSGAYCLKDNKVYFSSPKAVDIPSVEFVDLLLPSSSLCYNVTRVPLPKFTYRGNVYRHVSSSNPLLVSVADCGEVSVSSAELNGISFNCSSAKVNETLISGKPVTAFHDAGAILQLYPNWQLHIDGIAGWCSNYTGDPVITQNADCLVASRNGTLYSSRVYNQNATAIQNFTCLEYVKFPLDSSSHSTCSGSYMCGLQAISQASCYSAGCCWDDAGKTVQNGSALIHAYCFLPVQQQSFSTKADTCVGDYCIRPQIGDTADFNQIYSSLGKHPYGEQYPCIDVKNVSVCASYSKIVTEVVDTPQLVPADLVAAFNKIGFSHKFSVKCGTLYAPRDSWNLEGSLVFTTVTLIPSKNLDCINEPDYVVSLKDSNFKLVVSFDNGYTSGCPGSKPNPRIGGVCTYFVEPTPFGFYKYINLPTISLTPKSIGDRGIDCITNYFQTDCSADFIGVRNFSYPVSSHAILSPSPNGLVGATDLSAYLTASGASITPVCDNQNQCNLTSSTLKEFVYVKELGESSYYALVKYEQITNIYADFYFENRFVRWCEYTAYRYGAENWVIILVSTLALLFAGCTLRMWFALAFSPHLKHISTGGKLFRFILGGPIYFSALLPGMFDFALGIALLPLNILLMFCSKRVMFFPMASYIVRKLFKKHMIKNYPYRFKVRTTWPRDSRFPISIWLMVYAPFLINIAMAQTLGARQGTRVFYTTDRISGTTKTSTVAETITIPSTENFTLHYSAYNQDDGLAFTGGITILSNRVPAVCDYSYSALPYTGSQYYYASEYNEYCYCDLFNPSIDCWGREFKAFYSKKTNDTKDWNRCYNEGSDSDHIGFPDAWQEKVCGITAHIGRVYHDHIINRGSSTTSCFAVPIATPERLDAFKCANSPVTTKLRVWQNTPEGDVLYDRVLDISGFDVAEEKDMTVSIDASDLQVDLPSFVGVFGVPAGGLEIFGDLLPPTVEETTYFKYIGVPTNSIPISGVGRIDISDNRCTFGAPSVLDLGRIRSAYPNLSSRTQCVHTAELDTSNSKKGERGLAISGIPFFEVGACPDAADLCRPVDAMWPSLSLSSYNCDSYINIIFTTSAEYTIAAEVTYVEASAITCSSCKGFWGAQGGHCDCISSTVGIYPGVADGVTSIPLSVNFDAGVTIRIDFVFANPYATKWFSKRGGYVELPTEDLEDPPYVTPCTTCETITDGGGGVNPAIDDNFWDTWKWVLIPCIIAAAFLVLSAMLCCIIPKAINSCFAVAEQHPIVVESVTKAMKSA